MKGTYHAFEATKVGLSQADAQLARSGAFLLEDEHMAVLLLGTIDLIQNDALMLFYLSVQRIVTCLVEGRLVVTFSFKNADRQEVQSGRRQTCALFSPPFPTKLGETHLSLAVRPEISQFEMLHDLDQDDGTPIIW